MSLSRVILRNLGQKVVPPSLLSSQKLQQLQEFAQTNRWSSELVSRFSSAAATSTGTGDHDKSDRKEVTVSEGSKKSKLFPRRKRKRGLWWRNNDRDLSPSVSDIFTRGVGNAVVEAAETMNRLLENLSPARLIRRFKEKDESYHIKYQMPGLSKEDVKITIEDGMLFIRGEHKEEEEADDDDDEYWSAASYGFYNTSLMLPEDAKVDEIKAEMKDGVLHITIPKAEGKKKNVKEIPVG